jgi:hypothetical protein
VQNLPLSGFVDRGNDLSWHQDIAAKMVLDDISDGSAQMRDINALITTDAQD